MLTRVGHKIWRRIAAGLSASPIDLFPLRPTLPLPPGRSEQDLHEFLQTVRPADAPPAEMASYCRHDFRRFVYTLGLVTDLAGQALELGANPYFTTMLLRRFSRLELTLANFFGPDVLARDGVQQVFFKDLESGQPASLWLPFQHFNIEKERFPFGDAAFHVVLCCEILEHLLMDPLAALREMRRVLHPEGVLILTTPNVHRLENIARLLAGHNIYDPYSAYGPYGRHNREYTPSELCALLEHAGFRIEKMFTADVHENLANRHVALSRLRPLLRLKAGELGQYVFIRARNSLPARPGRPGWLYRSYSPHELVE
jgi:SAM-dependent methyltransferase